MERSKRAKQFSVLSLALVAGLLASQSANAQCASPSGVKGQIQYISPTMKYCDGSAWISMNVSDTGASCSVSGTINSSSGDIRYCNGSTWISMNGPSSNGSCSSTPAGTFKWNSATDIMEWCDGTNWKSMKAGGGSPMPTTSDYLAVSMTTSPYLIVYRTDDWSVVPIGTLPASASKGVDFSASGDLLAVSSSGSRSLWIYNTSDFSLRTSPQGSGDGFGVAFSEDAKYLVAADRSSSGKLEVYQTSNWSKVATTTSIPQNYTKLSQGFSYVDGDTFLLSGGATSAYFVKPPNFSSYSLTDQWRTDFSATQNFSAVGLSMSPYVEIQDLYGTPMLLSEDPTSAVRDIEFSPDRSLMALALDSSPYVAVYQVGSWNKVADPLQLPTGAAKSVSFSKNGTLLAVAHDNAPYLTVYDTATFTKLAGPSTLPSSAPTQLAFRQSTPGICGWQTEGFNSYPFAGWLDPMVNSAMDTDDVAEGAGALSLIDPGGGVQIMRSANFSSCSTQLKVKIKLKSVHGAEGVCMVQLANWNSTEIYATVTHTSATPDAAYQEFTVPVTSPAPGTIVVYAQDGLCLFDEIMVQ